MARFLIGLGVPVIEGYGLTETASVVATNRLDDNLPGSVGRPIEGVEVKVSDTGELLVRSSCMMLGYWQARQETATSIDRDGWLRTGDLAEIRDGRVFLRGRLKELIVLSTGEKVSPGDVETAVLRNPLFENALVLGDGRPFLAAILMLNQERWTALARDQGLAVEEPNHPLARAHVLGLAGRELDWLARHEQIRAVHLTFDQWTVANGLLTPTLKIRRGPLQAKYASEVAALFDRPPTDQ